MGCLYRFARIHQYIVYRYRGLDIVRFQRMLIQFQTDCDCEQLIKEISCCTGHGMGDNLGVGFRYEDILEMCQKATLKEKQHESDIYKVE